jgi:hypothetical protein
MSADDIDYAALLPNPRAMDAAWERRMKAEWNAITRAHKDLADAWDTVRDLLTSAGHGAAAADAERSRAAHVDAWRKSEANAEYIAAMAAMAENREREERQTALELRALRARVAELETSRG